MPSSNKVDQYISAQSPEHQAKLMNLRVLIHELAPEAVEGISYGMPGYKYHGKPLVYFACAKKHIGLYPTPGPIEHFAPELSKYQTSKGAIQFPHNQELPIGLIRDILSYRLTVLQS